MKIWQIKPFSVKYYFMLKNHPLCNTIKKRKNLSGHVVTCRKAFNDDGLCEYIRRAQTMRFPFLHKLLTNDLRYKPEHPEYRRVYLLNIVYIMMAACGLLFIVLNAVVSQYSASAVHAAGVVASIAGMFFFHKTDKLKTGIYSAIIILFVYMMLTFYIVKNESYAMTWICVFPPVTYFLLGKHGARIMNIIFGTVFLTFILIDFDHWFPSAFKISSIVNIVCSALALILLISYFESSREDAVNALEGKNKELETSNRALNESKDQLRLILDSTAEAIFGVDMENKCTFCNTSCVEMLGYKSQQELLGKDMHELIQSKRRDGTPLPILESKIYTTLMEGIGTNADDEVFWKAGGTSFEVEYNSYPQYMNGEVIGAVVTFTDITLRKMNEEKIGYLSSHDSLTGLLNRSSFERELKKADVKKNLPISIILGDLNGLKLTNDVFGHAAGDELLVKTAEILKNVFGSEAIISRNGGDEFAVVLPKKEKAEALQIIEKIEKALSQENIYALKCSMSLGCDTKASINQSIENTLKNAEGEMYKQKTNNRSKVNSDMINAIISTLYSKSPSEELHSMNVSELCRTIGEVMRLPDTDVALLKNAGFLHDIGKIVIDEKILNKSDELNEQDRRDIQQHPMVGYRILNLFDSTLNLAEGVYSHHERWDGNGYPQGLKGNEIPLMARIISVAEKYDSLVNHLRKSYTKEEALAVLRKEAGIKLDPHIVDVFINMMTKE
jgi:diguanylate cyclase (GGDEF)-like protein/PAS domain S-box-containing protein/putative nucleotidyltransferase with HDIG domain